MLLQKVKKVCKSGSTLIVDREDGSQWLGMPGALYPVYGIDLNEQSVRALFDISADDDLTVHRIPEKILDAHGVSLEDTEAESILSELPWLLDLNGRKLQPLMSASATSMILLIDADYLAPLKDYGELALYMRDANGSKYVAAKNGFAIVAVMSVEKIPDAARLSLAMISSNVDSVSDRDYRRCALLPAEEIE